MTSRSDKVAHVLRSGQDRNHTCHWPDCERQCPPAKWGCREHWFKLPKRLRDAIWDAYVPGQEQRLNPSREYVRVAREVQEWIASNG